MSRLRLGTRGSLLALVQAKNVKRLIESEHPSLSVEIVTVRTSGDKGDRFRLGAFVGELQTAVLSHEVDVALHCLKDVPTYRTSGLRFAAHLERGDVRDTLITRGGDWRELPKGAIVGTGSLRRTAQIRRLLDDVEYRPLVGNVDTRLRKLQEGEYDAIVLAKAGLDRLDWSDGDRIVGFPELRFHPLSADELMPAAGQAVLVLEARKDDEVSCDAARFLNDPVTEKCATAERAFLGRFGSGCSMPIGALAERVGDKFKLRGRVISPDGAQLLQSSVEWIGEDAESVGAAMGDELISQGARELLPEEALV